LNIEKDIIQWVKPFSYWFKYATSNFLEGKSCEESFIEECYLLFLENEGLKTEVEIRDEIDFGKVSNNSIATGIDFLKEISNVKNVNALETGQTISLSKRITVIFGENGTGKSGYTRLLNNAFKSRGDKEILSNIYSEDNIEAPECTFKVEIEGKEEIINYPTNENHPLFSQFNVFDSKSGQAHLTQENNLIFTPSGFEYFEKIIKLVEGIKERLNQDISSSDTQNEFSQHFKFENSIQSFVSGLSHETKSESMYQLGEFNEKSQKEYEQLVLSKKDLQDKNIPKQLEELQKRKTELIQIGNQIKRYTSKLSKDDFEYYNSLIISILDLTRTLEEESVKQFEEFAIKNIGTREWKEFIKSAKEYKETINEVEIEKCLLCQQDLSEKQNSLYSAYWKLLESQTQTELNRVKQQINQQLIELNSYQEIQFNDSKLIYKFMVDNDSRFIEPVSKIISVLSERKSMAIEGLSNPNSNIEYIHFDTSIKFLNELVKIIDVKRKKLIELNPVEKIADIQNQLNEFDDKKLLGQLIPSIEKWLIKKRWAKKAKTCLSKLKTNEITKKQGELFKLNVTNKYKEVFIKECTKLNAPEVVEINQRNRKGTTLRKLQVGSNAVNKILSEGEQNAISLSDFFTESILDENCKGIILDDPITSLDYKRRDRIAKRLIEEAKTKQIIIFTHNITFLLRLQQFARNEEIELRTTTIRKIRKSVGIIKPELPWIAQKVKDRIRYLRNDLVKLKKIETEGDPDEYAKQIKSWFGLLREGWERSVEERLFKGVIERFGFGIQTQKLKRVEISKELLKQIEMGMTESSNWIHDSAAGLNPPIPTTDDASIALERFDKFCKECKPA